MLTEVVTRTSLLSVCKECDFYDGVYGRNDTGPTCVHSSGYTSDKGQDLHRELRGLLRKASISFQAFTELLICESFTSRNLLEGNQIQEPIV